MGTTISITSDTASPDLILRTACGLDDALVLELFIGSRHCVAVDLQVGRKLPHGGKRRAGCQFAAVTG